MTHGAVFYAIIKNKAGMNPATTVTFRRVGACPRPGYGGVAISVLATLVPHLLGTTLVMRRRGDNVSLIM